MDLTVHFELWLLSIIIVIMLITISTMIVIDYLRWLRVKKDCVTKVGWLS